MAPFLVLWALLVLPKPWWRTRLVGAGVVLAGNLPGIRLLGRHDLKNGCFGFTPYGSWGDYIRTAQFADCWNSILPRELAGCASALRGGTNWTRLLRGNRGHPRAGSRGTSQRQRQARALGRTAMIHQPFAYLETAFNDSVRFVAPTWNNVPSLPARAPRSSISTAARRSRSSVMTQELSRWYDPARLRVPRGLGALVPRPTATASDSRWFSSS